MAHWQKTIPTKRGTYFTATRDGLVASPRIVYIDKQGNPREAMAYSWAGWWWSDPIEEPQAPPPWDSRVAESFTLTFEEEPPTADLQFHEYVDSIVDEETAKLLHSLAEEYEVTVIDLSHTIEMVTPWVRLVMKMQQIAEGEGHDFRIAGASRSIQHTFDFLAGGTGRTHCLIGGATRTCCMLSRNEVIDREDSIASHSTEVSCPDCLKFMEK